jgi:hypothetical protein
MVALTQLTPAQRNETSRMVFKILAWLDQRRKRATPDYPEKVRRTYDVLSQKYRPLGYDGLETLISGHTKVNLLDAAAFVHLESSKDVDWLVPVLSVKFDLARTPPEVRFRVAVFEATETEQALELRAVGYRFESPEGNPSVHGYWHVQPIAAFDRSSNWQLPCVVPPMSTHLPAIALDATNVAALLVTVLVSIYGMAAIDEILRQADFWPAIQSALAPMHCVDTSSPAASILAVAQPAGTRKARKAVARQERREQRLRSGR